MFNAEFIACQLADSGIVELRTLPSRQSSLHQNQQSLRRAFERIERRDTAYVTLNRPHTSISIDHGRALADDDIDIITRLFFDFDSVRPKRLNATADELGSTIDQRDRFVRAMGHLSWPMPALGISGNGAHALYRTAFRNNTETKQLVRTCYQMLAAQYSNAEVSFDRSVCNPARICRLYGSVNKKSPHVPNRPQRRSALLIPENWQVVPLTALEHLAGDIAIRRRSIKTSRPPTGVSGYGDYRTLDICEWFASKGMYVRHLRGNKHEVECPWEHEHSSSSPADTIVFAADGRGWPGFFCHHAHCEDRRIRDLTQLWGDADAYCSRQWQQPANESD